MHPDHAKALEQKSSAATLSDMEMFIFPELMYSLVLANIMSPRIWRWRQDPWFEGVERMKPYRRLTRLKQYIMDHYIFNLDLDTWGLTTKEREMTRFRGFIDERTLAESNALFGYEGDKYYFDIDIRTHFGLDKYEGNVIPYWKTEPVEAMDAFAHRPGYATGAGECVSLSTLYAAALFLVARIPLQDIFLMATPLHSQNFIDLDDGVLTNNRRLVTKNMWFNGTALSAQARRALENERVTIVLHETGVIHTVYPRATIAPSAYEHFSQRLRHYLKTPLTAQTLGCFLRHHRYLQRCFQLRAPMHGRDHYIGLERVMAYEDSSSYSLSDGTRDKLMTEIDSEEFQLARLPKRIVVNDLEAFIEARRPDIDVAGDVAELKRQFACDCLNAETAIEALLKFCRTEPRLPDARTKDMIGTRIPLAIDADMSREEIIARLTDIRGQNETADLAFYAYRDLNRTESEPFVKAAVQRSPVSIGATADWDEHTIAQTIADLPGESIYDETGRLAQPDEVWNFGRGDGAEKAVLMANLLRARRPDDTLTLVFDQGRTVLKTEKGDHAFASDKQIHAHEVSVPPGA